MANAAPARVLAQAKALRVADDYPGAISLWKQQAPAAQKASPDRLAAFWTERGYLIRSLLKQGQDRAAYDLAAPGAAPADARRARFFTDILEPGSTFKPLVMSAAIDCGAVGLNDQIDCDDNHIGKRTIHEDEGHHYGVLDPTGIIARSSNVGMARVGLKLGINRTYAAVRAYGFGSRTAL